MTLKLLFEEKHCARKNGSAKAYFFVVKLRIKFKVLSLNITHFFNCERIYNKYIILTVTWSEESDHVLIQPFGSSYCYNNIILTISRFEKLHVQTNRSSSCDSKHKYNIWKRNEDSYISYCIGRSVDEQIYSWGVLMIL